MSASESFLKDAEIKAFDLNHRKTINFNISKYNDSVKKGKEQYDNVELARDRAAFLKTQAIERLDEYLVTWETNFKKRGGKVIWATDKEEATKEILLNYRLAMGVTGLAMWP